MSDKLYADFFKKVTLFELITWRDNLQPTGEVFMTSQNFQNIYSSQLKSIISFNDIQWGDKPYADFSILQKKPTRKLKATDGQLHFEKEPPTVENWNSFIRSFCQVRDNLCHGAKLFKKESPLALDDRDYELMEAALAFINFLEEKKLVGSLQ